MIPRPSARENRPIVKRMRRISEDRAVARAERASALAWEMSMLLTLDIPGQQRYMKLRENLARFG